MRSSQIKSPLKDAVGVYERHLIKETLIKNHWNLSQTAQALGLPLEELRKRIEKHELLPNSNKKGKGRRNEKGG